MAVRLYKGRIMSIRVAINGFGRIGRLFLRVVLENHINDIQVAAINDIGDVDALVHLFKHDSNYGSLPFSVSVKDKNLLVNNREIKFFSSRSPRLLPWKELGIELVIESSGRFRSLEGAWRHLIAGAKQVVISAPPLLSSRFSLAKNLTKNFFRDAFLPLGATQIPMVVMGVNEEEFNPRQNRIVSNSSCTENCLAPLLKIFHESFGIQDGFASEIHGYTNDNRLLDAVHSDLRRARAAGLSIIPSVSRAGRDIGQIITGLRNVVGTYMVRIPISTVAILDLTLRLKRAVNKEEVTASLKRAARGRLKNILEINTEPLVSTDFKKSPFSSIVDLELLSCRGDMVKLFAWNDNEWGYACRLADLARYIANNLAMDN